MANIRKIEGKTGVSYKITVFSGRDSSGKQIRHYKTWTPEQGMTARQVGKELNRVAVDFEKQCEQGYVADDKQTFEQYAAYVLDLKARVNKFRSVELDRKSTQTHPARNRPYETKGYTPQAPKRFL